MKSTTHSAIDKQSGHRQLCQRIACNPEWYKAHQFQAGLVLLLGGLNVELITLLSSYLFHKAAFKAPISEADDLIIKSLGLYTNLLEVSKVEQSSLVIIFLVSKNHQTIKHSRNLPR